MSEMTVAAASADQKPAIPFNQPDRVANLHQPFRKGFPIAPCALAALKLISGKAVRNKGMKGGAAPGMIAGGALFMRGARKGDFVWPLS